MSSQAGARLYVRDFGPIKEARVELAPLTVFIGRNALGKSMLLYLLWVLETTPPDLEAIIQHLGGYSALEAMFKRLLKGEDLDVILNELRAAITHGFNVAFRERLTRAYGVKLRELIRVGAETCEIRLETPGGVLCLNLHDDALTADLHLAEKTAKDVEHNVKTALRLFMAAVKDITRHVGLALKLLVSFRIPIKEEPEGYLLVDGRSGIIRALGGSPGIFLRLKDVLAGDADFLEGILALANAYDKGDVDTGAPAFKLLLDELNFRSVVIEKLVIPRIYVETWTGLRLPLEKAPSGIRELLPAVLAILDRNRPLIYIEEPEAHLHPKAVRLMPRLMAYAINELGKHVRITTHSDILVSQINNLIAMSADPEGARELGYEPSELLRPEQVRAYWLRRAEDGDYVEVVELPVSETGFDEVEFAEVAEDLFIERGEVYRLLEAKEKKSIA